MFIGHSVPLLDSLVILDDLAFACKEAHEKLAGMSIHDEIREARKRKEWSMEQLAEAISAAEGLQKPLAWQTVQQWENGKSAPKRARMALVRRLLGLDEREAAKGEVFERLSPQEEVMLRNYRMLLDKDRKAIDAELAAKAEERAEEFDEFAARFGVSAAAQRANARKQAKSTTVVPITDKLKQRQLLDNPPPPDDAP